MGKIRHYAPLAVLWLVGLLAVGLIPVVWQRDDQLMRLVWFFMALSTLGVAALLTYLQVRALSSGVSGGRTGHEYLSTGCLHNQHHYCQSMTGYQGEKRPGRCKFCDARCVCSCHQEATQR
ncbi:hypothetical protein ACYBSK_19040 [Streptomyces sp. BYX5S]